MARQANRAQQRSETLEGEVLGDRDFAPPDIDSAAGALVEVQMASASVAAELTKAEIDQQISTAKKYPRSITTAARAIETLACMDPTTAAECIYTLKRDNKPIIGPSIRFAEIVFQSWGNCRVAARQTNLGKTHLEATGLYHDLETNAAVARSVSRSITRSDGKTRFSLDMIGVVSNAATSIALRNAILSGVPKAVWAKAFEKVLAVTRGTAETLVERRKAMVIKFAEAGATKEQVWAILGVNGPDDVSLDMLLMAGGILNSISQGETTLDALLADARVSTGQAPAGKNLGAAHGERTAASVDKPNGGLADSEQFTNPGPASDTKVGPKATRTADKGPAAQTAAEPEKPASDAQAGAGEGSGDDGAKASEVDDDAKIEQPAAEVTVKDEDPGEDEDVEEAFQASDEDEDEDDGTDLSEADAAEVEATDEADGTEPMIPGELTAFHITMTDARKWDDVLTALNELCRSAWWKAATVDQQDEALASAWSYIAALIDEGIDIPSHRKNPGVFRLWSLNQTDDKVVEGAWSDLATTSTYSKMPEGGRNALIKDKQRVLAKLRAANA